jgi:type I restriction enzyme S subunit
MNERDPPIDLAPDQWRIVLDILSRHAPARPVWAFGSRAKGGAKPHSDLDLAIITDQPLTLAMQAALADAFAESDLPWRVDIIDWSTASDPVKAVIARDRVVLTEGADA